MTSHVAVHFLIFILFLSKIRSSNAHIYIYIYIYQLDSICSLLSMHNNENPKEWNERVDVKSEAMVTHGEKGGNIPIHLQQTRPT